MKTHRVLIVIRDTGVSSGMLRALVARRTRGPVLATVLLPCPRVGGVLDDAGAADLLAEALALLEETGAWVEGVIGEPDAELAAGDLLSRTTVHELLVSESIELEDPGFAKRAAILHGLPVELIATPRPGVPALAA